MQCWGDMDPGRDEDAQGSGGKLLLRSQTVKTTDNRKEMFQEDFSAQAWHFEVKLFSKVVDVNALDVSEWEQSEGSN